MVIIKNKRRGRSGTRKYGRNKVKCEWYRRMNRRAKNKLKKLAQYKKRQPNNKQIDEAIIRWDKVV